MADRSDPLSRQARVSTPKSHAARGSTAKTNQPPDKPLPDKPLIRRDRLVTHLVLAFITAVGCALAFIYDPSGVIAEPLSLGLGYVSLVYIVASLLIGPLYLARQKRNPVNLFLRRDVGIWAGATALVHVFFSFQIFAGGQILLYFFQQVKGFL